MVVVAAGGTGSGASIGGATATRLAEEGARVVVGDIDEAAAERTVARITDDGGTAVAQWFDAADEASVRELVDRAIGEFGRLDAVHANAMDMSPAALGADSEHDLLTLPLEAWQRTIDVGLTGFLLTARHAIPHLLAAGGGAVVATVSGAVYVGEPVRVGYATVKTGMTAIVRHIASRWGREGVRANAVAPGMVPSPSGPNAPSDEAVQRILRLSRSPRLGTPDDIAAMVAFLVSDDGSWVNGQILAVDGGSTMRP